jgi:hypothetical protein
MFTQAKPAPTKYSFGSGLFAGQKRNDIQAIVDTVCGQWDRGSRGRRGHNIQGGDRLVVDDICGQPSSPLDSKGHPDPPLKSIELVTPQRVVYRWRKSLGSFLRGLGLECLQHSAHAIVECNDHRCQDPAVDVCDVSYPVEIILSHLVRDVRCVVR